MSYFDDASLVMIPSGYKTSKVYSVKPLDGSGDLTFTRSNDTATRVNSAGLIEKVRTNITLYSNDFSQWTENNTTITSDSIVGPFGTDSADLMTLQSTTDEHNVFYTPAITTSANNAYTQSFYVKKGTGRYMAAWMYFPSNLGGPYATYDLDTNTLAASGTTAAGTTYINSSIEVLSGGWIRISVTGLSSSSTSIIPAIDARTSGSLVPQVAFLGAGQTYYIYGAQLELSDFGATPYIGPTLGSAVSVGPVANVPRLDYLGSSCPRLLLEPQRTNLALYSEQFSNASWFKRANIGVTSNAITAPDGTLSADKIAATDNNTVDYGVFQLVASGLNTYSVFAKKGELNYVYVGWDNTLTTQGVYFNLNNGTISSNPSNYSASITDYGNGWYRCTLYVASNVSYFFVSPSANGTSFVFSGQSGNGIYLWGAQAEVGAYATSYIPTLGAAVTRGADACSKTGISSLIGQTEGTLFVDLSDVNDLDFPEITIDNNNNTDRIVLTRSGAGNWGFFVASSAASTFSAYSSVSSTSGKFALAYSSAGYALYRNGVQIVTGTYDLPTALSAIRFNGRSSSDFFASKCVKQAIIFPTRLSAADLAALTA